MDNINENIAENITKLRKRAGITQSDLADKLNYSDKAISKWERGENVPSIEMLYEIAKIFDVNIEFLISVVYSFHNEFKMVTFGSWFKFYFFVFFNT